MASSATSVLQKKAGMTVFPETTPHVQIQPVLVYNLNLMEKFQILELTGFFKKSVPWNRYATTTFAGDTDRGLSSESVISNAVKVTCAIETYWITAMEPKYQLSAVFCFWFALLSFFYCWNWRKFSVRLKKTGNTFRKWLLLRVL